MLALIGNFDLVELVVIAGGALLVFGKRLPEVIMQVLTQVMKLRRALTRMWREAGMEEEVRRIKREVDSASASLPSAEDIERQQQWRARIASDIEQLDLPEGAQDSSGQRADHPEDFDERERGPDEEGQQSQGGEEGRTDFHAEPDPEPTFPPPPGGPAGEGESEPCTPAPIDSDSLEAHTSGAEPESAPESTQSKPKS